jgi:glycopeptide antibiotics resistance protein
MNVKILTRIIFIVWALAIAIFSIIPYPYYNKVEYGNVIGAGLVIHFVAYFILMWICYFALAKDKVFLLLSGIYVFLCSMALEVVQLYLPFRVFNIKDVYANALGISSFFVIWIIYFQILKHKQVYRKCP